MNRKKIDGLDADRPAAEGKVTAEGSSVPGASELDRPVAGLPCVKSGIDPWFALRVKPNHEKPVAAMLRGKGFEEFLPLQKSRRQWSDRVKVVDLPLFPGYLFCRLNLEDRMPLFTTPGFLYIVGIGKTPYPVEESEIAAIQSVLRSGLPVKSWPSLVVGQRVQLKQGPLRGLEGVLTKIANQHRIYVSVTLLQRSISVEVDPEWVRAIDEGQHVPTATDGSRVSPGQTQTVPRT